MVVVDEVYGTEGAVALYLPHHSADAVAVGGVVFRCHRHYVVAHSQELARLLRYIPPHSLVHDSHKILCLQARIFFRLFKSVGHFVFREQLHWVCPCVSVSRGLQHCDSWRLMLAAWVGKIVHIELSLPVCNHRLVVVCGSLFGTHGLYAMHSHHGGESAVMARWQGNVVAGVVNGTAVVFYKVLHKFLRCHEHGAVFMTVWEGNGSRLVLEVFEILRALCAIDKLAIPVVIYIPPSVDVCRRRTFAIHRCEWF